MFENLVTYHIHRDDAPLMCPGPTPVYRYILAGNGVQVRAETRFFTALLLIAPGVVRGLPPLRPQFRLKVPRLPAGLLHTILADARRATRPSCASCTRTGCYPPIGAPPTMLMSRGRACTPSSAGWLPGRKSGCGWGSMAIGSRCRSRPRSPAGAPSPMPMRSARHDPHQ